MTIQQSLDYHLRIMKENFSSFWDLNHGPLELKLSVLPMSYPDRQEQYSYVIIQKKYYLDNFVLQGETLCLVRP